MLTGLQHQSYKQTLKQVHPPSALSKNQYDVELAEVAVSTHYFKQLWDLSYFSVAGQFFSFSRGPRSLERTESHRCVHAVCLCGRWSIGFDAVTASSLAGGREAVDWGRGPCR